jgi:glucose/mannose transport system substrate-binding protein
LFRRWPTDRSVAEFAQTYADAVSTFNGSGNIDAFIASMTQAQKTQLK